MKQGKSQRVSLCLTEEEYKRLRKLAHRHEITASELIRRSLKELLDSIDLHNPATKP